MWPAVLYSSVLQNLTKLDLLSLQKLFGHQMSDFHITMNAMWSNLGEWKTFDDRPQPEVLDRVLVKRKCILNMRCHFTVHLFIVSLWVEIVLFPRVKVGQSHMLISFFVG